jgi:hypothetical protein
VCVPPTGPARASIGGKRNHHEAGGSDKSGHLTFHVRFTVRGRACRAVEQHRIDTKFGPVDVRIYRLRQGWWPVAIAGRAELPREPLITGHVLPESVDVALQRLAAVIDAMTVEVTQTSAPPRP